MAKTLLFLLLIVAIVTKANSQNIYFDVKKLYAIGYSSPRTNDKTIDTINDSLKTVAINNILKYFIESKNETPKINLEKFFIFLNICPRIREIVLTRLIQDKEIIFEKISSNLADSLKHIELKNLYRYSGSANRININLKAIKTNIKNKKNVNIKYMEILNDSTNKEKNDIIKLFIGLGKDSLTKIEIKSKIQNLENDIYSLDEEIIRLEKLYEETIKDFYKEYKYLRDNKLPAFESFLNQDLQTVLYSENYLIENEIQTILSKNNQSVLQEKVFQINSETASLTNF